MKSTLRIGLFVALRVSLVFSLFPLSGQLVHAAGLTFYVDDDYGNPYPGTGTPTDPYHEIQMGINAASSDDTVEVAPGHYVEKIGIYYKILVHGAGAGHDPSLHSTIDGDGSGPVVTIMSGHPATLDGFTVTKGNAIKGGGMLITYSAAIVRNCIFEGNAADKGGGLAIEDALAIQVDHCTFSGNTANTGAGLYKLSWYPLTMTDCIVNGNSGDGMYQAGIAEVTRCEFSGNVFGLVAESFETELTVTDSTFSGNGSDGMRFRYVKSVKVTDSIFSGNGGSGIRNLSDHTGGLVTQVAVVNSIFVKNVNAGFWVFPDTGNKMDLRVKNCLFWENSPPYFPIWGAAMTCLSRGYPATVINTIMGGGGKQIQWGTIDVTYSDVLMESGVFPGVGNINAAPLFIDPDGPDNAMGTPDDNFRLRGGSPCIDAGTSDGAPETDMEGNDRFDDPGTPDTGTGPFTYYDMGPFEYRPIPCNYDVEPDGDVDGIDLAAFASEFSLRFDETDLGFLAGEFGRADCGPVTP